MRPIPVRPLPRRRSVKAPTQPFRFATVCRFDPCTPLPIRAYVLQNGTRVFQHETCRPGLHRKYGRFVGVYGWHTGCTSIRRMSTLHDMVVLFWGNVRRRLQEFQDRPKYDYVDHVIRSLEQ